MTTKGLPRKITVGVYGGSGYVGLETIRLLLAHPHVSLRTVTSREHAGKPVTQLHRSLSGLLELNFTAPDQDFTELDFLFVCVPHGESSPLVKRLATTKRFQTGELRIIDLGADFRLPALQFKDIYGKDHPCPELLGEAIYGNPEINREKIRAARLIANPGCFANCTTLGLLPLSRALSLRGHALTVAQVSAVTGSSGSGIAATPRTHHPERNESMSSYEALTHRHIPEIERALAMASTHSTQVLLVPHSGAFSRGIYATIFASIPDPALDARALYQTWSNDEFFIRYREGTPRLLDVRGTNFCDIAVHQRGNQVVILSAIDNLVKGAAGNAIQNFNLMCNFEETTGLLFPGFTP